ncbi:MAG: hypothetical protein M3O22_00015 [Pseudomonadota bacterium]|nr:hypothetical protein [Pseudomonadota bacterium]
MANRKVVDGPSWSDQDQDLRSLWQAGQPPWEIASALGRSVPAIMTRAARLGLPRRFTPGRKPRSVRNGEQAAAARAARNAVKAENPGNKQLRVCLMCTSDFWSGGPHNRICPRCKDSPEYTSASRLGEHTISSM